MSCLDKKEISRFTYQDHRIDQQVDLTCQLLDQEYETSSSVIIAASWLPVVNIDEEQKIIIDITSFFMTINSIFSKNSFRCQYFSKIYLI